MEDHRHARRFDLVGQEIRLGRRVEDDFDAKLPGNPQGGVDVGGPVDGHEQREPATEHVGEDLAAKVAIGTFVGIGEILLAEIILRLHQFSAEHRDRFAAGAGRLLVVTGAGVVAQRDGDHRHRQDHRLIDRAAHGLRDHCLAGDERAGRVARVDRCDPEAADPLDQPLPRIVGVDGPELGLNRLSLVELVLILFLIEKSGEADDGVGIDEPWRNHAALQHAGSGGDGDVEGGANERDFAVRDQHDALFDRRPGHRVHRVAEDCQQLIGGFGGGQHRNPAEQHQSEPWAAVESLHHLVSESRASVQQAWAFCSRPAP